MKNELKRFSQFVNESVDDSTYEVTIDLVSGENLMNYASTFADLAKVAPNCTIISINAVTADWWEVTLVGSMNECEAAAQYWNDLRGGDDIEVTLH